MHARQQQCACLQLKPYTCDHVQRAKIDPSHFTVAGSILAGIAFWAWLGIGTGGFFVTYIFVTYIFVTYILVTSKREFSSPTFW